MGTVLSLTAYASTPFLMLDFLLELCHEVSETVVIIAALGQELG